MPIKNLSWKPIHTISKKPRRRLRSAQGEDIRKGELLLDFVTSVHGDRTQNAPTGGHRSRPEVPGATDVPVKITSTPWPGSISSRNVNEDDNVVRIVRDDFTAVDCSSVVSIVRTSFEDARQTGLFKLYPSVEFNSLAERYRPLIDRYNIEFCKIPLTANMEVNPFRFDAGPFMENAMSLVHAVMALAGHHVGSKESQNHRSAALQLIRKDVNDIVAADELLLSVLDAVIVLFSLDETQSAVGHWNTHLTGAYALIEACGGCQYLAQSSNRVQVQAAILIWWDAIISIVAREPPVFPPTYADLLLNLHSTSWDFFRLCGCPLPLVRIIVQLTKLSWEKIASLSMSFVTFDTTTISNLESQLHAWQHIPVSNPTTEEHIHADHDKEHCSEAWRHGILLYIYRVFHWQPGQPIPLHILATARTVLNHVMACRDSAMISRQALLPLFFAGCEIGDLALREKVLRFCETWDQRTRYHLFRDTLPLLREVWEMRDTLGAEFAWWGAVVDRRHADFARNEEVLLTRICFG